MSARRSFLPFAAAALLIPTLGTAVPAWAQAPRYTAVDLGVVREGSVLGGINNAGVVAATYEVRQPRQGGGLGADIIPHPMLLSASGGIVELSAGGGAGRVFDVNDSGVAAGTVLRNNGVNQDWRTTGYAAQWTSAGAVRLGAQGPISPVTPMSRGLAINDSGLIVGFTENGALNTRAASWVNGALTLLGGLGGNQAQARDVNNAGVIVGSASRGVESRPVVWENGVARELGTLGGASGAANAVNDAGWIVGGSLIAGGGTTHAALWKDGAVLDLGAPSNGYFSYATGINAAGDIIGRFAPQGDGASSYPFLHKDGVTYDFRDLLDPAIGISHPFVNDYTKINDSGQFAGMGLVNGVAHYFLFTPVPEPSAAGLAATCAAGALLRRRRRGASTP